MMMMHGFVISIINTRSEFGNQHGRTSEREQREAGWQDAKAIA